MKLIAHSKIVSTPGSGEVLVGILVAQDLEAQRIWQGTGAGVEGRLAKHCS